MLVPALDGWIGVSPSKLESGCIVLTACERVVESKIATVTLTIDQLKKLLQELEYLAVDVLK